MFSITYSSFHRYYYIRSGQKLLLQQQELEKRMREYNDYHSKQIQNHQNLSLDYSINNQTHKGQLIVQKDVSLSNSNKNVTRNPSFVQNGGKSRLEITSREVKCILCFPHWDYDRVLLEYKKFLNYLFKILCKG